MDTKIIAIVAVAVVAVAAVALSSPTWMTISME